jgi:hypothetical protein
MLTKIKFAAAALLVLVVSIAAISHACQPAERIDGILKAIDLDKNTVVVMVTRDKDEDRAFDLPKDVAVTINGFRLGFQPKPGKLADLKAGMRVRVQLSDDKKSVVSIDEQRSQQGAARRDCPKCKATCGLELSREWCDSFELYKGQLTCWCEIAQYVIGTGGGRSAESQKITQEEWTATMDKAYADAKREKKLLLHIGNTGG